jgi:hypothetical protein
MYCGWFAHDVDFWSVVVEGATIRTFCSRRVHWLHLSVRIDFPLFQTSIIIQPIMPDKKISDFFVHGRDAHDNQREPDTMTLLESKTSDVSAPVASPTITSKVRKIDSDLSPIDLTHTPDTPPTETIRPTKLPRIDPISEPAPHAFEEHVTAGDELTARWRQTVERLHTLKMSTKYAAAMSTPEGDWDFERDTNFAMDCLLPWTRELLTMGGRPTVESFNKMTWIDTKDPGVYAALAIKRDNAGKIIKILLKVGCAWSDDGGLERRQAIQINDAGSKKEYVKHFCV